MTGSPNPNLPPAVHQGDGNPQGAEGERRVEYPQPPPSRTCLHGRLPLTQSF